MKSDDFPAGTRFFVKGKDGPYAIFPGPRPIGFRTFSFASGTKGSAAATGVELRGWEVSVEKFLAEVKCAFKLNPLSVEEVAALRKSWEVAQNQSSWFPDGTKFYVRGGNEPIVIPPDRKAVSWYGGRPTEWDNDHLVFVLKESKEEIREVTFAEFTRLVLESVGSTLDKAELLEEEIAPLLSRLQADRAFASSRPAVDYGDFMFSRPDSYGIWRDSDGDPI